jgi:hypothetical protein
MNDARATEAIDALVRDTRHAVRRLARDWRFTVCDVLILGLGIGANTAMFSVINAVLFRHASVPALDRLVDLYQRSADPRGQDSNSYPAYLIGTANAIGRRFRLEPDPTSWMEVIGVARDTGTSLHSPVPHVFYLSFTQSDDLPTTILAHSSQGAAGLLTAMQRELRAVDVTLPVIAAKTMAQDREDSLMVSKAVAAFLAALAALGLLLASIGLYAVVAFAVSRRSREIGIRMALGAGSQQVVWSVAQGVAGLVGIGTAL